MLHFKCCETLCNTRFLCIETLKCTGEHSRKHWKSDPNFLPGIDIVKQKDDSLRLDGDVSARLHQSLMAIVLVIELSRIDLELFHQRIVWNHRFAVCFVAAVPLAIVIAEVSTSTSERHDCESIELIIYFKLEVIPANLRFNWRF